MCSHSFCPFQKCLKFLRQLLLKPNSYIRSGDGQAFKSISFYAMYMLYIILEYVYFVSNSLRNIAALIYFFALTYSSLDPFSTQSTKTEIRRYLEISQSKTKTYIVNFRCLCTNGDLEKYQSDYKTYSNNLKAIIAYFFYPFGSSIFLIINSSIHLQYSVGVEAL